MPSASPQAENTQTINSQVRSLVEKRAVVGGASAGFVVGVVGLVLTSDLSMTTIGDQWVGDSAIGMFAAMVYAAASGGVVTAILADTGGLGTGINIVLADLLSSLMGATTLLLAVAIILGDVHQFEAFLLLFTFVGIPFIYYLTLFSIVIALVCGLTTIGVRRWWRDSANDVG